MADTENEKPHALSRDASTGRVVHRPHAFEVVVLSHFGPKHMHDDIAGIDQNPVALTRAVHRPRAIARFLQAPRQMLGNRGDMTRRTPGRDHDRVTERRAAGEVDGRDVLGLYRRPAMSESG